MSSAKEILLEFYDLNRYGLKPIYHYDENGKKMFSSLEEFEMYLDKKFKVK